MRGDREFKDFLKAVLVFAFVYVIVVLAVVGVVIWAAVNLVQHFTG